METGGGGGRSSRSLLSTFLRFYPHIRVLFGSYLLLLLKSRQWSVWQLPLHFFSFYSIAKRREPIVSHAFSVTQMFQFPSFITMSIAGTRMHRALADFGSGSSEMYDILAFSKHRLLNYVFVGYLRASQEAVARARRLGRTPSP